jgi:uncharacterized membrane protein YgcG
MRPQTPLSRTGRKMKKCAISLFLRVPIRHSIVTCLALVTVCALLLLTTVNVLASTVTISDLAGVLNAGQVQAVAAQVPDPIFIYTTETFTGDQNALNTYTRELLPNQGSIAIGIDTVHRNLSIEAGTKVSLSNSQASDAVSAFQSNYNGGDYTGATIAALYSILGTYGSAGGTIAVVTGGILLFIIGIVVVGLFLVFGGASGGYHGGSGYHGGGGGGGSSGGGGGSGGGAGGHF